MRRVRNNIIFRIGENMTGFTERAAQLSQAWASLLQEQPKLRIREAAARLGCSELDLLHARLHAPLNEPLQISTQAFGDWQQALQALPSLGEVMALVRNQAVVHEVTGSFAELSGSGPVRLFLGEQDQRLFLQGWQYLYLVTTDKHQSWQFFNRAGEAVMKIYQKPATNKLAWQQLQASLPVADDQWPSISESSLQPQPINDLSPEQVSALRADWAALADVHQFHGLLKKHQLNRLTALAAAGEQWAMPLPLAALDQVLTAASEQQLPLMSFVYNPDVVQIHTAPPQRVVRMGNWLNILDPKFNLHIDESQIASVWWVCRPSKDGVVNAIEAYDQHGQQVLQFFGARKEGRAELESWQALVGQIKQQAKSLSTEECVNV